MVKKKTAGRPKRGTQYVPVNPPRYTVELESVDQRNAVALAVRLLGYHDVATFIREKFDEAIKQANFSKTPTTH